jgi:hypothetical protein
LLCLVLLSERFAWQIAVTMTCCAFLIDLAKAKPQFGQVALAVGVTVGTLLVSACAARWGRKQPMLMLLMWASVGVGLLKLCLPPAAKGTGPAVMGALFVLIAAVSSWLAVRMRARVAGVSALALLLAVSAAAMAAWN